MEEQETTGVSEMASYLPNPAFEAPGPGTIAYLPGSTTSWHLWYDTSNGWWTMFGPPGSVLVNANGNPADASGSLRAIGCRHRGL